MNEGTQIGRVWTLDEAMEYYQRCIDAEKIMGPLSVDEKLIIANSIGKSITEDDLADLLAGKRVLQIKQKESQ